MPSNFRSETSLSDFLKKYDISGIEGIDTRALTKLLRSEGTMNGMITTNENFNLDEILPKIREFKAKDVSLFRLLFLHMKAVKRFRSR